MRPTDDDDIIYSVFNAVENDLKELKRLAASGLANITDDNKKSALIHALHYDRIKAAEILLKHGADPLLPNDLKDNALHWAAKWGDGEQVKLVLRFIKNDADVNIEGQEGFTALNYAIWHANYGGARLLLQRGADPNIPDWLQTTALMRTLRALDRARRAGFDFPIPNSDRAYLEQHATTFILSALDTLERAKEAGVELVPV